MFDNLQLQMSKVKAAEDGRRYNLTHVLDGAMDRGVLVERPMSPQLIIIGGIVCTENLIRVDDVMESPKLAE